MVKFNFNLKKLLFRSSKGLVEGAAKIVSKNPEAESLAETVVKRFTSYAYLGEKAVHFHLVIFGLFLGLTLMTSIIAIGKLAYALEIPFFYEHRDIVLNFGYASLFIGILSGFLRHYNSKHHKRVVALEISAIDEEFRLKKEALERDFRERQIDLEGRIKETELILDSRRKLLEKTEPGSSIWDTLSSYSPLPKRTDKNKSKLSD